MTDLQRFIELYKSFGIECLVRTEVWKNEPGLIHKNEPLERQIIQLSGFDDGENETRSDKFVGYCGFYASVEFDMKGNFIEQGFWE